MRVQIVGGAIACCLGLALGAGLKPNHRAHGQADLQAAADTSTDWAAPSVEAAEPASASPTLYVKVAGRWMTEADRQAVRSDAEAQQATRDEAAAEQASFEKAYEEARPEPIYLERSPSPTADETAATFIENPPPPPIRIGRLESEAAPNP